MTKLFKLEDYRDVPVTAKVIKEQDTDPEYQDRVNRIKASLERINNLMAGLKKEKSE
jgi:hypothetical protein